MIIFLKFKRFQIIVVTSNRNQAFKQNLNNFSIKPEIERFEFQPPPIKAYKNVNFSLIFPALLWSVMKTKHPQSRWNSQMSTN